MNRLARQIQDRAADDAGDVDIDKAIVWSRLLIKALVDGIASDESTYSGKVGVSASGELRPLSLDGQTILASIRATTTTPETLDFLSGCALAAIDEADEFANEIVSCVATGCVLHAVAARRSGAASREVLGTLERRRLVVDTNVLIPILGAQRSRQSLLAILNQAVAAGMDVIVPEHVLEELREVVDRAGEKEVPALLAALSKGINSRIFMQSVNNSILSDFLAACEEGTYRNWDDYSAAAGELRESLTALGILVRDHANSDRSKVSRAQKALEQELAASPKGRGELAIGRDAESMEMVWRARRNHDAKKLGLWPGGWILSVDTLLTGPTRASSVQTIALLRCAHSNSPHCWYKPRRNLK